MAYIGNAPYMGVVTGANVADGSIETQDVADGAITDSKMASGAAVANIGYQPATTGKSIAMAVVFGG